MLVITHAWVLVVGHCSMAMITTAGVLVVAIGCMAVITSCSVPMITGTSVLMITSCAVLVAGILITLLGANIVTSGAITPVSAAGRIWINPGTIISATHKCATVIRQIK